MVSGGVCVCVCVCFVVAYRTVGRETDLRVWDAGDVARPEDTDRHTNATIYMDFCCCCCPCSEDEGHTHWYKSTCKLIFLIFTFFISQSTDSLVVQIYVGGLGHIRKPLHFSIIFFTFLFLKMSYFFS